MLPFSERLLNHTDPKSYGIASDENFDQGVDPCEEQKSVDPADPSGQISVHSPVQESAVHVKRVETVLKM